jgi:hypothetical protein
VNRSLRSGSVIWCRACGKTLTKGSYGFDDPESAILEWVHGPEHLPPKCPFCKLPPSVKKADSESPEVVCEALICPLQDKVFSLKQWNMSRPEAWTFDNLLKRWEKGKAPPNLMKALKRAIESHQRGRWF